MPLSVSTQAIKPIKLISITPIKSVDRAVTVDKSEVIHTMVLSLFRAIYLFYREFLSLAFPDELLPIHKF